MGKALFNLPNAFNSFLQGTAGTRNPDFGTRPPPLFPEPKNQNWLTENINRIMIFFFRNQILEINFS